MLNNTKNQAEKESVGPFVKTRLVIVHMMLLLVGIHSYAALREMRA